MSPQTTELDGPAATETTCHRHGSVRHPHQAPGSPAPAAVATDGKASKPAGAAPGRCCGSCSPPPSSSTASRSSTCC